MVTDQGKANPILLNGRALGKQAQAPLADGDQMLICGFLLRVTETARLASSADAAPGGEASPRAPAEQRSPGVDGPAGAAASPDLIPQNFDPFADEFAAKPTPPPPPEARLPEDLDLPLGPQTAGEKSIDSMFGLSPGAKPSSDLFGPGTPLDEQPPPKGTDRAGSLLAGPDKPSGPIRASQRDDAPELHGSFRVPVVSREVGNKPGAPAKRGPEEKARELNSPPAQRRPSVPVASSASEDELLKAFLSGLGVDSDFQVKQLTPEILTLVGALLREAVRGTIDLLRARAQIKTAVHADVTLIAGRHNNPLKFSPDVATALSHLLAPNRGFMAPREAMQDAYNDLRSHTFGVMAGMRAALAGVLQRFDPAILETRLSEKSVLDGLLPVNRQAKLWNLFKERYSDISQEAEEDFHSLFGKAFLSAYEKQVARIRGKGDGK
jgi:type VI secretion system FHA domain protein